MREHIHIYIFMYLDTYFLDSKEDWLDVAQSLVMIIYVALLLW